MPNLFRHPTGHVCYLFTIHSACEVLKQVQHDGDRIISAKAFFQKGFAFIAESIIAELAN